MTNQIKPYFFISDSQNGWHNLAVDEYILNNVKENEIFLYIYINRDSVIIGKNQNAWKECNLKQMNADGVRLVRRITGGGAVFHDENNVNFSFIAGEDIYDLQRQFGVIVSALDSAGIQTEVSGRNDILANGRKFSGNAFTKRGHGMQHHGTLLVNTDLSRLQNYLNVSEMKIRSKGIDSVRSRVINLKELNPEIDNAALIGALKDAFEKEYGKAGAFLIGPENENAIKELEAKHSSWEWRLGETPNFDYELSTRFDWGEIQIHMNLKDAVISDIKVYTDANDSFLSEKLMKALLGCRFDGTEIANRIIALDPDLSDLAEYIMDQIA